MILARVLDALLVMPISCVIRYDIGCCISFVISYVISLDQLCLLVVVLAIGLVVVLVMF